MLQKPTGDKTPNLSSTGTSTLFLLPQCPAVYVLVFMFRNISCTFVISSVDPASNSCSKLSLEVIFLTREFPIIVDRELHPRET